MFDEDLTAFFDDFAVEFEWQGEVAKGIFDQATFVVPGQVLSVNDRQLTLYKPHAVFPEMEGGSYLTIEGKKYKVARVERTDDGAIDAVRLNAS